MVAILASFLAVLDSHADGGAMTETFDVVVIGGGAAGLSGATMLGRSRRSVLVVDAGKPRNAPAAGVHGFLSRDGLDPSELLAIGRKEVESYGGRILDGTAVTARRTGTGFEVELAGGQLVAARTLLVTTGLTDELPDVEGLRGRWGHDVLHCPYCHGWEVRDQPVGVLGSNEMAVHQALMFRQLTADVILFQHTAPALTDEQAADLAARGIRVVPGAVAAVEVTDDRLTGVRLADGTVVPRSALVVAPRFVANSAVLADLGLRPVPHPLGAHIGESIPADPTGKTEIPGVWAAGNVTNPMGQVMASAAAGAMAGAGINGELVMAEAAAR
jgi:thioredoxin reductase